VGERRISLSSAAGFSASPITCRRSTILGARQLFAADLIAFGTFADFVTGRDAIEKQQWRNIWGTIDRTSLEMAAHAR
jgi:hypothetical protein